MPFINPNSWFCKLAAFSPTSSCLLLATVATVGRGDLLGRMGSTPHGRPEDEGQRPLSGERGEPGRLRGCLVLAAVRPAKSWAWMARQKIGEGIGRPRSYQLFGANERGRSRGGLAHQYFGADPNSHPSLVNDRYFGRAGHGSKPNSPLVPRWWRSTPWRVTSRSCVSSSSCAPEVLRADNLLR